MKKIKTEVKTKERQIDNLSEFRDVVAIDSSSGKKLLIFKVKINNDIEPSKLINSRIGIVKDGSLVCEKVVQGTFHIGAPDDNTVVEPLEPKDGFDFMFEVRSK